MFLNPFSQDFFLVKPILNLLIWLYNVIPGADIGLAIIAVTILVRILLYPSFQKSLRAQKDLAQLQPRLDEIRQKHKGDKEAETKAILKFYQENKVNPFSSCLPLLIQMPILIALYHVFRSGLHGQIAGQLYGFVQNPGVIDTKLFGLIELAEPNVLFAIAAGASQFVQSKLMAVKPPSAGGGSDKTAAMMNMQFTYIMPVITTVVAISLEAGLSLYWVITTLFAIGQQWYIMRKHG